jgi:glycogen debranching enzyme
LTVRVDLEDRNFHWETRRTPEAEHHFRAHTRALPDGIGFAFTPASDRTLRVYVSHGLYHAGEEWSERVPHPVEQSRGQNASGDAFSPGWFEIPLGPDATATLTLTAEPFELDPIDLAGANARSSTALRSKANGAGAQDLASRLVRAVDQFVVRRGAGRTVIAGYPWFLDWGRDTLIFARGLIAAKRWDTVEQVLTTFGRFEKEGTLPNSIAGEDASNRDTSDAPLWYGIVCEELFAARVNADSAHREHVTPLASASPYKLIVDERGRTVADVLRSIASHYLSGTPNGIRVDPESGLVWSPSHFTWMDTNHPAGTPREGYPVEIQALWCRLLRQVENLGTGTAKASWRSLAQQAADSLKQLLWLEELGYLADALLAPPGTPAGRAIPDTALRSNALLAVSLGSISGERARRCVTAARNHLLVPGALRSLAPLRVSPPLPIRNHQGRLLNDPDHPYWGRYEGDEDSRRKPAYHNGTAWTWTLPVFCEALARAWDASPTALAAARSYLGSIDALMRDGCLGHLPEIVDGDAPHRARGCDAQAWSVSEALRVWNWLSSSGRS